MPRKKVVVFAEGHVAINSLIRSLQDSFYGISIQYATASAMQSDPTLLDQDTLAFILPGIIGEECHYYDVLGDEGNKAIRQYVEDGGTYMGLCAGAYYACETIEYAPAWGNKKTQKPGLNFFNAVARGPVTPDAPHPTPENEYNDLSVLQIFKENGDTIGVCYGNGPALENAIDDNLHVIARYKGVKDTPISIARKPVGKGQALFVGVVPEISSKHGIANISTHNVVELNNDIARIVMALHPHEEERATLWQELVDIIKDHNAERGRCQRWGGRPCPA
ncbi:MAG: hypothetical protein H6868_08760 [Rhodospirillales bacterium]|nr:hypothetical protein [Rhodospirillales bacterium]